MTRKPAITATGLTKSYSEKTVLDGIDLSVDSGTVFALLGPNGAGKTTIVEILSTLTPADSGNIRIAGTTLPTIPMPCAQLSVSPGNSPRWTTISPARRTYSSWPTFII